MRRRVAWPGVAVKTAKGHTYYYWTRVTPWTRLPDPLVDADGFMRKLGHLNRIDMREREAAGGSLATTIRLYRKHPDFTSKSANTQRAYRMYLDRLVEIFPEAGMKELTGPLVQRYVMDEHADTRGAANMMLRVLRIIFKWAGKRERGLTDPTIGIEEFEGGEHEPWPDHLVEAALASDNILFRAAVGLHLFTGQRTGDTCKIAWNSISNDGIPVRQQKTGTPLLIPVHPQLTAILADTPRRAITVLTNSNGRPLTPAAFLAWVKTFGAKHEVKLVPHGLRKNAVNALLEAGCSTAEVGAITGQSLQMVEHYAKGRNQTKLATVAMLKWGGAQSENGKTLANIENYENTPLKSKGIL